MIWAVFLRLGLYCFIWVGIAYWRGALFVMWCCLFGGFGCLVCDLVIGVFGLWFVEFVLN